MTTNRGGRPPVGPRITLRFPTDLLARLDAHAEATGTTRSDLLRRGAEQLLDKETTMEEHRVISADVASCLSGPSERLTCSCGWEGHSTRWNDPDHKARGGEVPRLPAAGTSEPITRRASHAAIYGDRHRCAECA